MMRTNTLFLVSWAFACTLSIQSAPACKSHFLYGLMPMPQSGMLETEEERFVAFCRALNPQPGVILWTLSLRTSARFSLISELSPPQGQGYRLAYLHSLLGVDRFDDTIRYQLVQRTASALLTAREFHASVAVMLVHAFDTPAARRGEFEAFRKALSAHEIAPLVYHAKQFQGPALFLVWCDGDASFRNVLLPSVL